MLLAICVLLLQWSFCGKFHLNKECSIGAFSLRVVMTDTSLQDTALPKLYLLLIENIYGILFSSHKKERPREKCSKLCKSRAYNNRNFAPCLEAWSKEDQLLFD